MKRKVKATLRPYLYLLPALIILAVFLVYPIGKSFAMGFYTKFDYLTDTVYEVRLDNFQRIFNDDDFWLALKNTLTLVLFGAPLAVIVPLFFAVLLNGKIRFKGFFQSVYFLPFITSMVAVSIVWSWILNKDFGLLNSLLGLLGIKKIAWLTDKNMTLPILIALNVWKGLGYRIIIFLAGLQSIDQQYHAAARVDGAKPLRRFFHITLPLLKPTMVFVCITTVISTFKIFDEVYVMYSQQPGPLKSGLTIVYYIFHKFYRLWEFTTASAAAVVLFVIIFLVSMLQFVLTRDRKKGKG